MASIETDESPATQMRPPEPATQPATFETELAAAKSATDRDGRVAHLRRALALRPGDADNLNIEFEIGILLGQRDPVRQHDSLDAFERIVQRYDHANYYHAEPENSAVLPAMKVPRAAILAASILNGAAGDDQAARKYAVVAMKDMQWTFERRRADWQNEPRPTSRPFDEGALEQAKLKNRIAYWEKRKTQAARGDIRLLGPYGEILAEAAVRQYFFSAGVKSLSQMRQSMDQIIRDFPGTPMAKIAQKNIESGFSQILGDQ
jgi:hypothetical protein